MLALKWLVGKYIGHQIWPDIYQLVKKEGKTVSMCGYT